MSNIDKINVNGTEYGIEGVDGDSKDDTTTFTSSDVADGSATTWTSVNILASGEKHSSIFGKVSQMFKNVRYLYKLLGTTDFSGLGTDISGALNNLGDIIVKGVETSSTASQAYAVNEYMIYNKKIYKVKAAIASGATITVGTNIESANTNVGNELTSLRSSLTTSLINCYVNNVALTYITNASATSIIIVKGAIVYKRTRNPIFCVYVNQSGDLTIFEVFTGQSTAFTFGVAVIHGTATTLTASVSGDDILISGLGSWGSGFAIGMNA